MARFVGKEGAVVLSMGFEKKITVLPALGRDRAGLSEIRGLRLSGQVAFHQRA